MLRNLGQNKWPTHTKNQSFNCCEWGFFEPPLSLTFPIIFILLLCCFLGTNTSLESSSRQHTDRSVPKDRLDPHEFHFPKCWNPILEKHQLLAFNDFSTTPPSRTVTTFPSNHKAHDDTPIPHHSAATRRKHSKFQCKPRRWQRQKIRRRATWKTRKICTHIPTLVFLVRFHCLPPLYTKIEARHAHLWTTAHQTSREDTIKNQMKFLQRN